MTSKIITYSFYALFFLTPLIWIPLNQELFEYNKMIFVYLLTIIIATAWILKMISRKKLLIKSTPLDLPLWIFLLANVLSTIFSIDKHISLWGYYSRSNGGLFSTISYIVLYYGLVSNLEMNQIPRLIKFSLWGALLVSLWAIPEHFGSSFSCLLLTGHFDSACWIQDVKARVFATLGQPNWLAAYLTMLIFPALYFFLSSKKLLSLIAYCLLLIALYLAFTFTYSRGATLGLFGGLAVFALLVLALLRFHPKGVKLNFSLKPIAYILIVFLILIINILFGSALTSFTLLSKFSSPTRETITLPVAKPAGTQLENGGTESGTIRLIVWKGAIEVFKHYPILGSGVETFAYSYYQFRPKEHNLVSEWDFLYNKAHNEYLNYLATTGIIGFATYLLIIGTFIVWSARRIKQLESEIKDKKLDSSSLLLVAILASYISYLIQNIFSFSVVIIALFFYLFPALSFVYYDAAKPVRLTKKLATLSKLSLATIYRRQFYTKLTKISIFILAALLFITVIRFWVADIFYAQGLRENDDGRPSKAYGNLTAAVKLNPYEPLYRSELGYSSAALSTFDNEATESSQLRDQAILQTEKTLKENPYNTSLFRTAIKTYYLLSTKDNSFTDKTVSLLDKTAALSPTDPKLIFNKGLILQQSGREDQAIEEFNKALSLKPNYREVFLSLAPIYFKKGDPQKAILLMNQLLSLYPGDTEALENLKTWQKKI